MTYPATNFEEAVSNTITSSDQLHQVINGGVTDTVTTESGEIPSVRKALTDNMYFVEAIPWVQGSNETVFNQLRTFTDNAVYWAPNATVSNPVPMGVAPEGDSNWALAPVSLTEDKIRQTAAQVCSNSNLLSNHNFLIQTPDDEQLLPDETPRSYPSGYQIFSGVFANETTGITNLTYIDGRVSFSGGDFYMPVPNTGGVDRSTEFVASVADFDGKPRTRGVSFALVGDEYRVTVGVDALEDVSTNPTPLGSVKFEQGSVATRHEAQTNTQKKITSSKYPNLDLSSLTEDYTVYLDSEVLITSTQSVVCRVVKIGGGVFNISAGATLNIYKLDCGPFQVFKGDGIVKLYNSINGETYPEWFGAVAYSNVNEALNGVDSSPSLNKVAASLPAFGGEVRVSGLYGLDSSFEPNRQGVHVKGIGAGLASGFIARTDVPTVNITAGVYEVHLSDLLVQGFKDRTDPQNPVQGTQPCIKARDADLLRFTNIYTEEGFEAGNFFGCADMHIQSWLGEDSTNGLTLIGCKQCTCNEVNFFDLNKLGDALSPTGHFIKINATSSDNTLTNLNYRQTDKKLSDGIVIEGVDNSLGIGSINDLANNAIALQGSGCSGNTLSSINSRNSSRHVLIDNGANNNQIEGGIGRDCSTGLKVTSTAGADNDIYVKSLNCTTSISVDAGAQQQKIDDRMLRTIGTTAQRPGASDGVMIGFVYTNTETVRKETWNGSIWLTY